MNVEISWQTVILALIASLPPTIAAVAAIIQSVRTHQAVDGRLTQLLEETRKSSGQQATIVEKNAQQVRDVAIEQRDFDRSEAKKL